MKFKTCDLPGIGRKYSLDMATGHNLVVVTHNHGQREIYLFDDPDDDEPIFNVEISDEESRQLGAILLGVDYQPIPDDRMELISKKIRLNWFPVNDEVCFVNSTIAESGIRKDAKVTIVGIERGDDFIPNPDSSEKILSGDILMVIGKREPIKDLENLCKIRKES